jgi:hypothetical protein
VHVPTIRVQLKVGGTIFTMPLAFTTVAFATRTVSADSDSSGAVFTVSSTQVVPFLTARAVRVLDNEGGTVFTMQNPGFEVIV